MKLVRLLAVFAIAAVTVLTTVSVARSAGRPPSVPGWGYGDKNNTHTGPPGLSVAPQR